VTTTSQTELSRKRTLTAKPKQPSPDSELQQRVKIETVKKRRAFSDVLGTNKNEGQLTKPNFFIYFS
jgi:hypothetical protein